MGQSSEGEKSPPSSMIYEKRVVADGSLSSPTGGVQVVGMHARAHTHTHTHTHRSLASSRNTGTITVCWSPNLSTDLTHIPLCLDCQVKFYPSVSPSGNSLMPQ